MILIYKSFYSICLTVEILLLEIYYLFIAIVFYSVKVYELDCFVKMASIFIIITFIYGSFDSRSLYLQSKFCIFSCPLNNQLF